MINWFVGSSSAKKTVFYCYKTMVNKWDALSDLLCDLSYTMHYHFPRSKRYSNVETRECWNDLIESQWRHFKVFLCHREIGQFIFHWQKADKISTFSSKIATDLWQIWLLQLPNCYWIVPHCFCSTFHP